MRTGTIAPNPPQGLPHDEGVRSTPTHMKAFRPDMNSQEGL